MEEFVYYNLLFDIYGSLLPKNNIEYYTLYYEENLTMQEIADLKGVSKSYVGRIIDTTRKRLDELESYLGINSKKEELTKLLDINDINEIKDKLKDIID